MGKQKEGFSSPEALKKRAKQSAEKTEWKIRREVKVKLHCNGWLPRWLGPLEPGQKGEFGTDVARLAKLRERALDQNAPWLSIDSDLVVVGEANRIELVYLRDAVTEREADDLGDILGSLHDQGVAEGGAVAEDPETSFPRADGSRPQVVEVGHVASGVKQEGMVRTALERQHACYKRAVDEVTSTVVTAVRRRYQHAFSGLTDLQRALVAIVPHSCVSTAAITRDYQSRRHRDSMKSCSGGLMSGMAWFARGEGAMPAGGELLIHDLKLRLETASSACVLFDSAALWHSTEECAPSGPGQAARMGVALYCSKDVLAMADEDSRALLRAYGY